MNIGLSTFIRDGFTLASVERAFRQLAATIAAGWEVEHHTDGTHGDVTAESIDVAGTAAIGEDATITGDVTAANGQIELLEQNPVSGTGTDGSGITIKRSNGVGEDWGIIVSRDNWDDSIGFFDKTNNVEALKLYRNGSNSYSLQPSEDGVATVTLGDRTDSDFVFDSVAAFEYYVGTNSVAMGKWTSVAYNAANFTASAGTWTVDSGDQVTYAYTLVGNTMTLAFFIQTTDVSNAASLRIAIPGGLTAAKAMRNLVQVIDAGTAQVGLAVVAASGTYVEFFSTVGAANFTVTAGDNTYVIGQITFEVS